MNKRKQRGNRPKSSDFPRAYFALDTETTMNFQTLAPLEVGAVAMVDGREIASYEGLIRPDELPISGFLSELTGITTEMVEDAPSDEEVMDGLFAFFDELRPLMVSDEEPPRELPLIVGHNISFDRKVVQAHRARYGLDPLEAEWGDTLSLARRTFPKKECTILNHKLGTVFAYCQAASWEQPWFLGTPHRALFDARMSAYILEAMRSIIVREEREAG